MKVRCLGGCGRMVSAGRSRCPSCLAAQKSKYHTIEYETNRLLVLARDGYVCQINGPRCTHTATEADHIDPHGGSEVWNMQAACKSCNSGKRDR